ncbi:MAG TPA: hypothetical protein VGE63_02415 [Candidatus Paceibacterota bacterium]
MKKLNIAFLFMNILFMGVIVFGFHKGYISLSFSKDREVISSNTTLSNENKLFKFVATETIASASFGDIPGSVANPHGGTPYYDEEADVKRWESQPTTVQEIMEADQRGRHQSFLKSGLGMTTWSTPEQEYSPKVKVTILRGSSANDLWADLSVKGMTSNGSIVEYTKLLSALGVDGSEKNTLLRELHAALTECIKNYSNPAKYRWYYANDGNDIVGIQCRRLTESTPFFSANLNTFLYKLERSSKKADRKGRKNKKHKKVLDNTPKIIAINS